MQEKIFSKRFIFLSGLIFTAALIRLIPHPPNFAPITAMALFGGAYFSNKKFAFIIPLAAMFVTDLILGFHNTMWAVYLSFIVIVLIGMSIKNKKITNIALASVGSSILFFVLTNFAFWTTGLLYYKNLTGLAQCYVAAIPFFHNTVIGDLIYTAVLFGTFELAKAKLPKLVEIK
jgi:hypothetical protein